VSKYLEQDDNLWSKDDVKRAMDKCKGRGPRELKVNLLQDGGSGEIIFFFVRNFFIRAASSSLGTAQPSSVQLRKP